MITEVFFLIAMNLVNAFSQNDTYNFYKIKTNNELIANQIVCMTQDNKGFIWFGTNLGGLYRFDGYNYKVYTRTPGDSNSLSNNEVKKICDDGEYLWIATNDGLSKFIKTTERFRNYKFSPSDNSSLSGNVVKTICITKDNELWVGTDKGLNKLNRKSDNFTRYPYSNSDDSSANEPSNVNSMCEDSEGYLWIGTCMEGLFKYDFNKNIFYHYDIRTNDLPELDKICITDIFKDNFQNIWIATFGSGLFKFNKRNNTFSQFQKEPMNESSLIGNHVYSSIMDEESKLWFSCLEGVSVYNPLKSIFINPVSKSLHPGIYIDHFGTVWSYSWQTGFELHNKNRLSYDHYDFSSDEKSIVCTISQDVNGYLWTGGTNGIEIFDKNLKKIKSIKKNQIGPMYLDSNTVWNFYRDKRNIMWILNLGESTPAGYNTETNKLTEFRNARGACNTMLEDNEGNFWFGYNNGGIKVFNRNMKFIKSYFQLEDNPLYENIIIGDLLQNKKGDIVVATNQGLAIIEQETNNIQFYKNNPVDSNSISNDDIYNLAETGDGVLWITTVKDLNKFDPITKTFRRYTEKDGISGSYTESITCDKKGNIWVSTEKGISMLNPENNTFSNYGIEEGGPGLAYLSKVLFTAEDGKIVFASFDGLYGFYPDSIPTNRNIPNVVITDFKIFNKQYNLDTTITEKKIISISYKENFFSFDYAALDYINPGKNQYAYKLEGIDENWNYVGNDMTASYTDISPGEYVFKVKGSNNDGLWNDTCASVKLIITPPWYETILFRCFSILSLIGGIGFLFRKRLEKINKEKGRQEEFTKKLIESQENDRKRIAAELHDSLGQDLAIIKSKALISLKKTNDPEVKEQMIEISNLTSSTIDEVREISYNLRPYELDRLGLGKTIKSLVDKVCKSTGINFICAVDDIDKIFTPEIEINIYRILQECITNILKHSNATEAFINLKKSEKEIRIYISDNGKGFDAERKVSRTERRGFGLKGIPERVKLFQGDFKIESVIGNGTSIKITIPFQNT